MAGSVRSAGAIWRRLTPRRAAMEQALAQRRPTGLAGIQKTEDRAGECVDAAPSRAGLTLLTYYKCTLINPHRQASIKPLSLNGKNWGAV